MIDVDKLDRDLDLVAGDKVEAPVANLRAMTAEIRTLRTKLAALYTTSVPTEQLLQMVGAA